MASVEHARTTPHEWASPEYVRWWAERTDREEERRRPRFELLADVLPFEEDDEFTFCDLGAGYGALTAVLLERFPHARAVCVDGSRAMLDLLRERQGKRSTRIETVVASYDAPEWVAALGDRRFGAVVESQALHGQHERRRRVYREIHDLLVPGGWLLTLDLVPARDAPAAERTREAEVRRRTRARELATGTRPSREDVLAEIDLRRGHAATHDGGLSVGEWTEDLRWLAEAGFQAVDCYMKDLRLALIGGRKPDLAPRPFPT